MPEVRGVFGRNRELGAVAAFLDGLRSGPSGLLLEGEAGIGKTTVWSAGVAGAAERSYLVLSSRPTEAEAKLSFAALADLLDGVVERVLADLPRPQQNALRVALLLEAPAGSPPEPRAVCAAFLGAIRRLAAQGPVVIAVDDLQWLDGPSACAALTGARGWGTCPREPQRLRHGHLEPPVARRCAGSLRPAGSRPRAGFGWAFSADGFEGTGKHRRRQMSVQVRACAAV